MSDGHKTNLVPRLSSLHSLLKEETLVNAGHVAPRFSEPACEELQVVLVKGLVIKYGGGGCGN